MGDPTEQSKGEDSRDVQSDTEMQADSEHEDAEAEPVHAATTIVVSAAVVDSGATHTTTISNQRVQRTAPHHSSNLDTVHSILSSISNPNAAFVIPVDGSTDNGEEEIDADRMERFYTGALSAITKVTVLLHSVS